MSSSRPFPSHVPTLTEVVEETPIPEKADGGDGAIVSDFVIIGGDEPKNEPKKPVIPQPQGALPPRMQPAAAPAQTAVPAVQSDTPAQPALAHDIAVLTEVVSESEVLPPVDALLDDQIQTTDGQVVAAAESTEFGEELIASLTDQITENLSSSMVPVIEGLAEQMVRNLQTELTQRMRLMVAQAVAQELNKRRPS